jgi:hypothetical protein
MIYRIFVGVALAALLCGPASAQEPPLAPPPAVETPPTPAVCCTAPAGSLIELEILATLRSDGLRRGDLFDIRLAEPVKVGDLVILPAGLTGGGEVVHAAKSSIGGKPGELQLAARYLQYGDRRIALKGMKLGSAGRDNSGLVLAATFVTPLAMFVQGGEVTIPPGTRANAKLAADLVLPALAAEPAKDPAAATPAQETPPQEVQK